MGEIVKITPVEEAKSALVSMKGNFASALPDHIDPDKFVAVAQIAIMNNPDLVNKCDRQSLYVAFTKCAQDGLIPDGREAALIPFAGKAKYIPMVAGICKKARNSGEVSVIDAKVVYENDTYDAWTDEKGAHFNHRRVLKNRGVPVLTYAYAIMKDGGVAFEEIDEDQMNEIRKKSSASDSPWKGPFVDEMRRKSALKRLAKYRLPNSSDLDPLLKHDDDFYEQQAEDPKPEKTEPSRLAEKINAQATTVTAEVMPAATAQEAAQDAKKVFTGARDVNVKPQTVSAAKEAKGKIVTIKVTDSPNPQKPWRRFGVKIGDKFYGTFDKEMGERMQKAVDLDAETTITYTERVDDKKNVFRDILTFEYEEGEPIPEDEVPI